jgi:hypothetical protein
MIPTTSLSVYRGKKTRHFIKWSGEHEFALSLQALALHRASKARLCQRVLQLVTQHISGFELSYTNVISSISIPSHWAISKCECHTLEADTVVAPSLSSHVQTVAS